MIPSGLDLPNCKTIQFSHPGLDGIQSNLGAEAPVFTKIQKKSSNWSQPASGFLVRECRAEIVVSVPVEALRVPQAFYLQVSPALIRARWKLNSARKLLA